MRLGIVIGRVTLNIQEPVYKGGTLLLVQPLSKAQFATVKPNAIVTSSASLAKGNSVIAYDELGAGQGAIVGFTEGAEATAPFTCDAPIDAYIACIVEQIDYAPPQAENKK
jgi:microcompartment protein CcmK/EutM